MSDPHAPGGKPARDGGAQAQIDAQLLAALYGAQQQDDIDLWEYGQILWRRRRMIAIATLGTAVLAALISLLLTNMYRAETVLAPVVAEEGQGNLPASFANLGGLASLAGVSLGGGSSVEEHLAVLQSHEFIWRFVRDRKLMPVLFADDWDAEHKRWNKADAEDQPSLWDAYRLFRDDLMRVAADKKTGLVTLSVDWKDATVAADWANDLVQRLNDFQRAQAITRSEANLGYLREELGRTQVEEMRQTLFELISQEQKKAMVANTQQEFAFRVLDAAAAPDEKARPRRALIVVLATLVAAFLAVFTAFVQEGVARRRGQAAGEGDRT